MAGSVSKWYNAAMEAAMIELTEQQAEALEHGQATPPRIVNPRTKETFVLLRVDEYERLKEGEYDDSPWTREELQALAWEVAEQTGWEEYEDAAETP
jgi:PHD/YefM family antitoxin component YafN of YafNO toxin-antitoxin module